MAKDCPRCGLTNPPVAERCDCGYDFTVQRVLGSYLTSKQRGQIAKTRRRKKILNLTLGILSGLWALRELVILPTAIVSAKQSAFAEGMVGGAVIGFIVALLLSIFFFRRALRGPRNP